MTESNVPKDTQSLLPCPFCGSVPTMASDPPRWWEVQCTTPDCDCVVSEYATEGEAIEHWNRRALDEMDPGDRTGAFRND